MKYCHFLFFLFALGFLKNADGSTIYVNTNAIGLNNGSNWINAYNDLQNAITAANFGDTVWVASGTYKTTSTTNRTISFQLKNGVALYGGFAGFETALQQRNPMTNITTLSGEIGTSVNTDNAYHVVQAIGVSNSAYINGFNIVDGRSDNTFASITGGGLYNSNGSPIIEYCTFQSNYAEDAGGGIIQIGGNLTLRNCKVINNISNHFGAGIHISSGTINLSDCDINNNISTTSGAGVSNNANLIMNRCIVSGNSAGTTGGGIVSGLNGTFKIYNSLIVGNKAATAHAGVSLSGSGNSSSKLLINCIIAHNANNNNSATFDFVSDASIYNTIISGNTGVNSNFNFPNQHVHNCIITDSVQNMNLDSSNITNQMPVFTNPGHATLAPFSASVYNYHSLPQSVNIDGGNQVFVAINYNTDLDSLNRTYGYNTDIGCYELPYCTTNATQITALTSVNVCGDTVVLSAPNGQDNFWFLSHQFLTAHDTLNATMSGKYFLKSINTNGCIAYDSVEVMISPVPQVTIFQSGLTLNASMNLINYQWYQNGVAINGANNVVYNITQNGQYYVIAENLQGCADTSNIISVTNVGLSNIDQVLSNVYYANGILYVNLKTNTATYHLYDMAGRVISKGTFTEKRNELQTRNFIDGVYILSIKSGTETYQKKIVLHN